MSISKVTLVLSFTIATLIGSAQTSLGQYIDPNPVIIDGGKQYKLRYDPFSGRMQLDSSHSKVRESYFDPNRNNVDPGSYEQVNEYQMDQNGVRWHVTGTRWTSGGRPHSNLTRTRSTPWGNEKEYVASSVGNSQTAEIKPKYKYNSPTPQVRPTPGTWPGHSTNPVHPIAQPSQPRPVRPTPGIWPGHSTNPVTPIVQPVHPQPVRPTVPQNGTPIRQIIRRAPQGGISIPGIFGG